MPSQFPKVVVLPDAGAENPFQYELVRYLQNHGIQVTIGKKYTLGSTFKALTVQPAQVLYYDWVHSFILGKTLLWSWLKSFVFMAEIVWAKSIKRVRIVHTLHNLQNHAGIWLKLERRVYGFFLRRCNHIRVYSETTKQEAVLWFGLKPEVISVIQDLPYHLYYPNEITKPASREILGIDPDDFVFLFFGEIKPYKGLHQLLKAYSVMQTTNTCLVIAGKSYDADYWDSLQKEGENKPTIHWHHRFIEDQEVQYFFNAADVAVLPFVRIDHSGSVDLAMSFGKPIITLRTDSTAQLLSHQSELLFDDTFRPLTECLKNAQRVNLEVIGRQNFEIADTTNYRDIVKIFES
ncbi:glycosyltransferase family 4 protein [Runella sp.]|uniref:glycosyltransferase family 4 protein n=1 Tax=Runella sp. TaxID=1960881 RepID=UPI003D0BCDD8